MMEANKRAAMARPPADSLRAQRTPARPAQPARPPRPAVPRRMPRVEALALTHRLKRRLLVASLGTFALLVGLTAQHITGVTAAAVSSSQSQQSSGDDGNTQSGGFFGSPSGSGGSSFGSGGGAASPRRGPRPPLGERTRPPREPAFSPPPRRKTTQSRPLAGPGPRHLRRHSRAADTATLMAAC